MSNCKHSSNILKQNFIKEKNKMDIWEMKNTITKTNKKKSHWMDSIAEWK